jgi:hypothetical protein
MSEASTEDDGFAFADRLYALIYEHGPNEMSRAEKDALAGHLLSTAIEWVKARNRAVAKRRTLS